VPEFYGELKSLIDELEMHESAVTDAATLRGQRQDFTVSKFMSGLSLSLRSQVPGHILGGDSIPTLTVTFSRVMCVSTGTDVLPVAFIEQFVMTTGRGRGRGREHDHEFGGGRSSFEGGRSSSSGK